MLMQSIYYSKGFVTLFSEECYQVRDALQILFQNSGSNVLFLSYRQLNNYDSADLNWVG